MQTYRFKTNIHCQSCVRSVSAFLNEEHRIKHWRVDVESPEKVLTVQAVQMPAEEVCRLVEEAGFDAKLIN